jgi:hypothetical protein
VVEEVRGLAEKEVPPASPKSFELFLHGQEPLKYQFDHVGITGTSKFSASIYLVPASVLFSYVPLAIVGL